jgi:hypothetical protein
MKLTKNDKLGLLIGLIIVIVIFTIMHFVLKQAPLITVNPN